MLTFMTTRELFDVTNQSKVCQMELDQIEYVELEGWLVDRLANNQLLFNDGTVFSNTILEINPTLDNYHLINDLPLGTAVKIIGKFIPQLKQLNRFKVVVTQLTVENKLLETNTNVTDTPSWQQESAEIRVKNSLNMAIHEFFQNQGFLHVALPIQIKLSNYLSFEKYLLNFKQLEQYALRYRDVYNFSCNLIEDENCEVQEITLVKTEMAFADNEDNFDLMDDFIKHCLHYVSQNCQAELSYIQNNTKNNILAKIDELLVKEIVFYHYPDLVKLLVSEDLLTDIDLSVNQLTDDHYNYLTKNNNLALISHLPQENNNQNLNNCLLLLPNVGCIIYGSQKSLFNQTSHDYYPSGCQHSGFVLDFDKLVKFILQSKTNIL